MLRNRVVGAHARGSPQGSVIAHLFAVHRLAGPPTAERRKRHKVELVAAAAVGQRPLVGAASGPPLAAAHHGVVAARLPEGRA